MTEAPPWLVYDREHVWHPYSTLINPPPVFPVVGAEGCRIRLADGRELIDGMASWWSAIHGYRHPRLDAAVREQLSRAPRTLPTMRINPEIKSIDEFAFEDFELLNYQPHPHIAAPVAV